MKTFNKVLTVSILAITAVTGANAVIVSETMLSKEAGTYNNNNTVEMAIADAKKAGTDAATAAATAQTTADGALKTVTANNTANGIVTNVAKSGTAITMTKALIKDANIATDAAIAKSKLATDVQTSLGKADTALQAADIAGKQDIQIGAAKSGSTASTDSGKAVVVDDNGKIAMSTNKLGSLAYKSTVASADITNGTIVADDLASNAVTSAKIADGTIVNADIADGTITNAKLANIAEDNSNSDENADNLVTVGIAYNIANTAAGASAASAAADAFTQAKTYTDTEVAKKVTANAAITGGTGTKITYDAKGLVTGSASLAASDIPTLTTAKISGLDTALEGKAAKATTLAGYGITDAYTKSAVDTAVGAKQDTLVASGTGQNIKGEGSVTVSKDASTGMITISGTDTKYTLPNATTSAKGGVIVGSNIGVANGTISVADAGTSTKGVMKLQTTTGTGTDGTMTQKAITDELAKKQNTLVASGTGQNIKGEGSVTVSKDASTGMITISGTDNNTTYSTGTTSTAGLTKLYTATGSATDGTMTQKSITDGLAGKVPTTRTVNGKALSGDIELSASDVGADASGAAAAVEAKLTTSTPSTNGYDINAKSLKVNGTSVLTSLSGAVLTSGNQTATGTKTFSGTVAVTGTATVSGANTTAGKQTDGTAVAAVTGGNVKDAIVALDKKKQENLPAIPATPSTDGMYVLTAKVVDSATTYYWEDIGR